jgi:N-acetylneuraminic acid mutarotase
MPRINSFKEGSIKSGLISAILVFSFLTLLSACDSNNPSPKPNPVPTYYWSWVSGSNAVNQAGSYGTQGTADPSNVPGARSGAVSWRDSGGNLWLFGGNGYDSAGNVGYLNDIWKCDGTNWTWISGSNTVNQAGSYGIQGAADPSNVPGARSGAVSQLDPYGKLWLFGGNGVDSGGNSGYLNDVWKYDPATLEWTWVSGSNIVNQEGSYGTLGTADPSNVPGARDAVVVWRDSGGKLWLFGGYGLDSGGYLGYLNDVWKYDPATLEWTWVSGGNTVNQAGAYGTQGRPDPSNVPGARGYAVTWLDYSGKLWLFGGNGYDSGGALGALNDLWTYDRVNWTWQSGSNTVNQAGTYGTQAKYYPSNVSGARQKAVSQIDIYGNLWLFGGNGYDSGGALGALNDLWEYNWSNWAWISGSRTVNQVGTYLPKGAFAAANVPGAREGVICWLDSTGQMFWLFGGFGYDSAGNYGLLNDLWKRPVRLHPRTAKTPPGKPVMLAN